MFALCSSLTYICMHATSSLFAIIHNNVLMLSSINIHGIVIVLSVSGNFFRIRSAFAFGAKRLARLLDCPKDKLNFEVNQFFTNTWERHGSGHRPDAPGVDSWRMKLSTPDTPLEIRNSIGSGGRKVKERSNAHGLDVHAHGASRSQSLKSQFANHSVNDTEGRLLFARTHSSPELTDNHSDTPSQVQRGRQGETGDARATYSRSDDSNGVPNNYALSEEFTTTSGAQLMHQEDQDIVNMMASASLQGFNGQFHVPYNLASGHLPYSIPPSLLASMGYTQRNFPGFVPANIPMMDPSFSHLQFARNLVPPPPHLAHCFPGIGLNPSEDTVDQNNENLSPMDSVGANNDCWQEQDSGSSGRYDLENGNLDPLHSEEKPPASLKYIPPQSRIAASSGARVQHKHPRDKRGAVRDNTEIALVQDMNVNEVHVEEKSGSSRYSAAHGNSLRSRTSSESSWDGSSVKALKSTKERRGKKIPTDLIVSTGKGKVMSEHAMNDVDDDQEWGSVSNMGIEIIERNHMPDFEVAQTSGSDSMMPFAPVLINPGSRHGTNDSSGVIAFYPTGPPIPFLTMLPFYNVPPEAGTSDAPSGHFGGHEAPSDSESVMNLNRMGFDQLEEFNSSTSSIGISTNETSRNRKADILNSDFVSHWQSLQFGRVCQNPRYQGPSAAFPSPVMVPPVYVQGRVPYDIPARPISTNSNLLSQLVTNYGNHLVPVTPLQSASGRFPNVYPSYMDDVPRYRSGTGTYLPNPVNTDT